MKNKKVAIIGAGITGLTTAYLLSKKGYKVTIFEKSEEIGGLATSFKDKEGCIYDYGPHQICTENPNLLKILKELLGDDLLIRKKNVSQYFFKKYVPYPPKPIDYFIKLPLSLSIRVFLEVIGSRIEANINSKPDYSFEAWTKSRFGTTLYNKYFKPYTIKTWGVNPNELDPSTASSRISFNSIFDIFFKTVKHYITKKDDYSTTHNPLKHKFYYPKGGNIKLMQELYNSCKKENIELKKGYEANELIIKNKKIVKIKFSNKKSISNFKYIINTAPFTKLIKMIGKDYKVPLKFRDMVVGLISFNKESISPYHWIYYPDTDIIFQRICEFKHFKAGLCPPKKTGIAAEITCFKNDKIWKTSDELITKRIINDMKKVGLLKRKEKYLSANIFRIKNAYPLQTKGFQSIVKEIIKKEIQPIENLVTIGRQGLFKYCNENECMEMAIDISEQIEKETKKFNYNFFENKWVSEALGGHKIISKE